MSEQSRNQEVFVVEKLKDESGTEQLRNGRKTEYETWKRK